MRRWSMVVRVLGFVVAALVGCAETSGGGSESNFVRCEQDSDCHRGESCVHQLCRPDAGDSSAAVDASVGNGGTSGLGDSGPAGGSGNGGTTGGVPNGGARPDCGGLYVAGAPSTGLGAGGVPNPVTPTCPVDTQGIADVDSAAFCTEARCPAGAAELLTGLSCTKETSSTKGITLSSGCGVQRVRMEQSGSVYEAYFETGVAGAVAMTYTLDVPFGSCQAYGYRTGTMPAGCPGEKLYACELTGNPAGTFSGCRSPNDPDCGTCCTSDGIGSGCYSKQATPQGAVESRYDYESYLGECPCNCAPCATCTLDADFRARTLPNPPANCECPSLENTGGTTGAGGSQPNPDPCYNYCLTRASFEVPCPGIGP